MTLWKRLAAMAFVAAAATGCTVNPVTGENQLTLMSPQQEVAVGEQQYGPSRQSQGGRYVVDPDLGAYVSQVGQKLAAVSDRPDLPYEFSVLNNHVPNAWALPGGKIAINRGLLVLMDTEAELAAVLGHEIVHAAARHSAQQQTRGTLLNVGMVAAGVALANQDQQVAGVAMGALGVGAQAWQANYSRDQELQADKFGVEYMVEAGYNPEGAVDLQKTFVELSEGQQAGWLESFFASHPPSQERVEANRRLADQYGRTGTVGRQSYQRAIAQLKEDQDAYKAYEQALKATGEQDYDKARTLVAKAIEHQPEEVLFWELKGRLQAQQDDFDGAADSLDRAIAANPEFFRPYVYRGLTYRELEKPDQAAEDFSRSMEYLPTQIASYYLGEYHLEQGDRDQAMAYFRQAAQGNGEIAQAARAQLQKLQVQSAPSEQ